MPRKAGPSVTDGEMRAEWEFALARSGRVERSAPWNVLSGALVARLQARQSNREPAELAWTGMDVNVDLNHDELAREPKPSPQPEDHED